LAERIRFVGNLNYRAAVMAAERLGSDAQIGTVFADRMERYFSTELFRLVPEATRSAT
jgi:cysteine synthase A